MNSPAAVSGGEVYVKLNPEITAQLQSITPSLNGAEDVHICGGCKQIFPDINLFFEHKRGGCPGSSQKPVPITGIPLSQQAQTYLCNTQDNNASNHISQYLRVILNEGNESQEQEQLQSLFSLPYRAGEYILPDHEDPIESCISEISVIQSSKNKCDAKKDVNVIQSRTLPSNDIVPESAVSNSIPGQGNSLCIGSEAEKKLLSNSDVVRSKQNNRRQKKGESSVFQPKGANSNANDVSKTSDSGTKRRTCPVTDCTFSTSYPKDLMRHMRKHTGEKPFQCETCKKSYSRLDKLQSHMHIHFGEKSYKCNLCEYATLDKSSLKKHMRVHNDERPFKCQMCPYRSKRLCHLTIHLRKHTGDHPFVCEFESCMSAFKTSSDLKRHIRMHTGERPFACDICGYRCSIKSNLGVHIRVNHATENLIPCSICNHVSVSQKAAKEHEKIHSGNLKSPTKKKLPGLKSYKKLKGKEVNRLSGSERGRALNAIKPFCVKAHKCTLCDAAFVREDSWRSHMRQHQNQTSYLHRMYENEILTSVNSISEENEKSPADDVLLSSMSMLTESPESQQTTSLLDNSIEDGAINLTSDTLKAAENEALIENNIIGASNQPCDLTLKGASNVSNLPFISGSEDSIVENSHMGETELSAEVLENDTLETQSVLVYVQNENDADGDNVHSTDMLTSSNDPDSVLLAERCGQYLSVPSDQCSLVDQITASLQGIQYVLSAPTESLADANETLLNASYMNNTNSSSTVKVVAGKDFFHSK